jgi:alkylated DNA nucleotide flippase Atl1
MKNGQKYLDAAKAIERGRWITYGDLAERAGVPAAVGARAAGQAVRWCDAPEIPLWRVFPAGGELPSAQASRSHTAGWWRELFERRWAEEGLLETVDGHRRARPHLHA